MAVVDVSISGGWREAYFISVVTDIALNSTSVIYFVLYPGAKTRLVTPLHTTLTFAWVDPRIRVITVFTTVTNPTVLNVAHRRIVCLAFILPAQVLLFGCSMKYFASNLYSFIRPFPDHDDVLSRLLL